MRGEIIAKKYANALVATFALEELERVVQLLDALALALEEERVAAIFYSPDISKEQRAAIVLDALKGAKSKELESFAKLLIEHGRVEFLGTIVKLLKRHIAFEKREFEGVVYSALDIDEGVLKELSKGLGRKYDATIDLSYVKSDFDGIKVESRELGVEISLSKSRIGSQILEHVLKAI